MLHLIKKKRDLDNLSMRLKYGFLYSGFRKSMFFWEFIIMYKKFAIIFASSSQANTLSRCRPKLSLWSYCSSLCCNKSSSPTPTPALIGDEGHLVRCGDDLLWPVVFDWKPKQGFEDSVIFPDDSREALVLPQNACTYQKGLPIISEFRSHLTPISFKACA